MNKKTIVVVGAGKGLGNAVARLFLFSALGHPSPP